MNGNHWQMGGMEAVTEGRRPSRSEVNKFVGPKARARELSRANSSGKKKKNIYIYIYIYIYVFVASRIASLAILFVLTCSDFYFLVFIFYLLLTVLISVILLVYSVIFATLILHSCRLRFSTTSLLSCTFCHL